MNKKKAKLVLALLIVIGAIGGLVYSSMESTVTYYMKPSELLTKVRGDEDAYGKRVRVGGLVVKKSIKGSAATRNWQFMVTDDKGDGNMESVPISQTTAANRVLVKYKGVVPDTFKEGVIAIADGSLDKEGVFVADTVLAKCPSKYQEAEKKDKAMGKRGAADKSAGRALKETK